MTNHTPVFTSSSATGSFTEFANLTDSTTLHTLSGTMSFKDSDKTDTHTTTATLHSAVVSGGTIVPAASLAHFQAAMQSQILSDSNGNGQLKWSFSDQDEDFDFLAKNQTLTLTYDVKVSDNHGGFAIQTVNITVTGTDDKPVINMATVATVTEQANQTLSLSPDTVHVALNFTDDDLANTGHTATVIGVSASGATAGLLPGPFGDAELMAFYHVDNVVKTSGSATGTINTTFSAPDLAFDYLSAGQHLDITYTVQLDDHAGGVSTQTVKVTVVGTNDKPVFLSCPESAALVEDQNVSPTGNLTAHDSLLFADVDLADAHVVSTTVTATRSGGGAIPLTNAQLLAAFGTGLQDSTGHVIGEVDWSFAFPNASANFLNGGETLKLVYHVAVDDGHGGSTTQDVTITILGVNHPVVITSGAESSTVVEQDATTGSSAPDTTPTIPAGTLAFTDQDTNDTHTVTVTLDSSSGPTPPAATQADLATALTTALHDSTGTGTGSIDWNFAIPDKDLDYLAANETLTVNYDVKIADGSTSSTQTVSVVITGANDAVAMTSGPQSASLSEQAGVTGSSAMDTTSPVPTGTLNFTDVDLSDGHSVNVVMDSAVWSANPSLVPPDTLADLQTALTAALHDSTGTGVGSVDWTFSIKDADLDFLSPGETLTVQYDVIVADATTTSTQTVTVTINGTQDPLLVTPVTVAASDTAANDTGALIASGLIADVSHPVDLSTPRSIVDVNGSAANVGSLVAGAHGSLLLNSDGSYAYYADASVDPLQAGDHASDVFNFTVDDGQGHQATTTLTFNVAGVNDNPAITAASASGSVTEDAGPAVIVNGDFETGNLTGWSVSGSHIHVQQYELGGSFGHYSVQLAPTGSEETLTQQISTTPGQHYFVSFDIIGDPEGVNTPFSVTWDGVTLLSLSNVAPGVNHYAFDVPGDSLLSTTTLQFAYADDTDGMILDSVNVSPATGPATESTGGSIAFSDAETGDIHTAGFAAAGSGYVGAFTLDPVSESGGTGSVGWHFTVNNADIQFLAQGQTLAQDYFVTIDDGHGGTVTQDVTVTLNGTNDAPTAVSETVVTDVGTGSSVAIAAWALALNDTDPDTTDHVGLNAVTSSSGGSAGAAFGFAFFTDDATAGGSFDYTATDGIATSSNTATATVINNAASASVLNGTSGDDVIVATNGTEALNGGGGNDVLIGTASGHVMTGGSGNDTFAFLQPLTAPSQITDFNNTTQHDRIAISASSFGGGLTAGMDVTSTFETSADNTFSGAAEFHFDTGNQTLYFSADGTQGSAVAVVVVQAAAVINPHDILLV
ncbi:VCBS domain-containing protein [Bradyrhizobium sp. OK095]|uniref:VCBS domain-containing protein n=1 Tax=Bradyrhizobium sp. OK095 TaxID=1882760 RepID=UPI0008BD7A35|nr:VCBS domain-containing protein [Bradyrhizobium sp. OK095]SEM32948.1 VCBS repeat-containing protein [Bradyrhizobium sp. OK095]